MVEDFWGPIFAKLHEDMDLLTLICEDTSDTDLVAWIKPNPILWPRCARYIQRKKVVNRQAVIKEILNFAGKEQPLRKIILLTWVDKNPITMRFASVSVDSETLKQMIAGDFGNTQKLKIMEKIDPRAGIKKFYDDYFSAMSQIPILKDEIDKSKIDKPTSDKSGENDALRKEIDSLREELKEARKSFEARANEIAGLQRSLLERDHLVSKFSTENEKLSQKINRLKLEALTSQPMTTQEAIHEEAVATEEERLKNSFLSEKLEEAEANLASNSALLARRDATISRLQKDLIALKNAVSKDEDKDRKIENLQQLLIQEESSFPANSYSGQVLSIDMENGKRQWLLQSFSGEFINIPAEILREKDICLSEFCTVFTNENGEVISIESLEPEKFFMIGSLVEQEGVQKFVSNGLDYSVNCKVRKNHDNRPMKGFFLGEFQSRSSGIYEIFPVNTVKKTISETKTADLKSVMAFLNISNCNAMDLLEQINAAGTTAKLNHKNEFEFAEDFRKALSKTRMSIRLEAICPKPECQERRPEKILARNQFEGEPCLVCKEIKIGKISQSLCDFGGKKIIIFGGDYAGKAYKDFLGMFNLDVTWESGFQNMGNYRSGLGKYDLVVVILRQVSHTLLREIVQTSKKEDRPILYCKKRGTTGLLIELRAYYSL